MAIDGPCRCSLGEDFQIAGISARLCQHSRRIEIVETKTKLYNLLNSFDKRLSYDEIFSLPINEAAEFYMRTLLGRDHALMNEQEKWIMTANFMRQYQIIVQISMLEAIERLFDGKDT